MSLFKRRGAGSGEGGTGGAIRTALPEDGNTSQGLAINLAREDGDETWRFRRHARVTVGVEASLSIDGATSGAELQINPPDSPGWPDTHYEVGNSWRFRITRLQHHVPAVPGVRPSLFIPGSNAASEGLTVNLPVAAFPDEDYSAGNTVDMKVFRGNVGTPGTAATPASVTLTGSGGPAGTLTIRFKADPPSDVDSAAEQNAWTMEIHNIGSGSASIGVDAVNQRVVARITPSTTLQAFLDLATDGGQWATRFTQGTNGPQNQTLMSSLIPSDQSSHVTLNFSGGVDGEAGTPGDPLTFNQNGQALEVRINADTTLSEFRTFLEGQTYTRGGHSALFGSANIGLTGDGDQTLAASFYPAAVSTGVNDFVRHDFANGVDTIHEIPQANMTYSRAEGGTIYNLGVASDHTLQEIYDFLTTQVYEYVTQIDTESIGGQPSGVHVTGVWSFEEISIVGSASSVLDSSAYPAAIGTGYVEHQFSGGINREPVEFVTHLTSKIIELLYDAADTFADIVTAGQASADIETEYLGGTAATAVPVAPPAMPDNEDNPFGVWALPGSTITTTTQGGMGGGTVSTADPVSGDGSGGNPITIADGAIDAAKLASGVIPSFTDTDRRLWVANVQNRLHQSNDLDDVPLADLLSSPAIGDLSVGDVVFNVQGARYYTIDAVDTANSNFDVTFLAQLTIPDSTSSTDFNGRQWWLSDNNGALDLSADSADDIPINVILGSPDIGDINQGDLLFNYTDGRLWEIDAVDTTNDTIDITQRWDFGEAGGTGTDLSITSGLNTITIHSSSGSDTTLPSAVAGTRAGLMTQADKTKLDGIEASADANDPTNLSITRGSTSITFHSSTGTDVIVNGASPTAVNNQAGVMTAADKTKLDGIEEGATAGGGSGSTDLSVTRSSQFITIHSSSGDDVIILGASGAGMEAGMMTADDKVKLDGIEEGATAASNEADVSGKADTDLSNVDSDLSDSERATFRPKVGATVEDTDLARSDLAWSAYFDISDTSPNTVFTTIQAGGSTREKYQGTLQVEIASFSGSPPHGQWRAGSSDPWKRIDMEDDLNTHISTDQTGSFNLEFKFSTNGSAARIRWRLIDQEWVTKGDMHDEVQRVARSEATIVQGDLGKSLADKLERDFSNIPSTIAAATQTAVKSALGISAGGGRPFVEFWGVSQTSKYGPRRNHETGTSVVNMLFRPLWTQNPALTLHGGDTLGFDVLTASEVSSNADLFGSESEALNLHYISVPAGTYSIEMGLHYDHEDAAGARTAKVYLFAVQENADDLLLLQAIGNQNEGLNLFASLAPGMVCTGVSRGIQFAAATQVYMVMSGLAGLNDDLADTKQYANWINFEKMN